MHELAIANGIIEIVRSQAQEKGFKQVLEISLCVGEYSGIVPECLREFFPIAAAGTPAESAQLDFETIPASFQCLDCGYTGTVDRKKACCPQCGSLALKMTSGREFYVDKLKVE